MTAWPYSQHIECTAFPGLAYLFSFSPTHARLDLAQYLADVQDAIDEHAVGWALDFEVTEEGIRTEQGEDLVQGVI